MLCFLLYVGWKRQNIPWKIVTSVRANNISNVFHNYIKVFPICNTTPLILKSTYGFHFFVIHRSLLQLLQKFLKYVHTETRQTFGINAICSHKSFHLCSHWGGYYDNLATAMTCSYSTNSHLQSSLVISTKFSILIFGLQFREKNNWSTLRAKYYLPKGNAKTVWVNIENFAFSLLFVIFVAVWNIFLISSH